jgi:hypothetical protein
MHKPRDLTTAFGLARLQEEEVKLRSRGQKYQTWGTNSSGYSKLTTTSNTPRLPAPPPPETRNTTSTYNNFNRKPSILIKQLTPAQM